MDSGFGRPEDKDIQREFMKKIRGDKLQAINAECELEICLAFKDGPKESKKPKQKNRNNQQPDENKLTDNELALITIEGVQVQDNLLEKFNRFKEEWVFEEIEDGDQLPEYFFDDGCDLSYIIHRLMQEGKNNFNAGQLIFLQLLCLWGRNLLNKSIKEYYDKNMSILLDLMNTGLEKIQKKLKNYQKEAEEQEHMMEVQKVENSNLVSQSQNEEKRSKNQPKKTKQIAKEKKPKSKKEVQKKDYPEELELAIKTCNYICWAYWYVIKK